MKKVIILGAFLLSVGVAAFAEEPGYVINKLNNKKTFERVSDYLDASYAQRDQLKSVFEKSYEIMTDKDMNKYSSNTPEENAYYYSIGNAKAILSPDQYKKFVKVVNVTLHNEDNRENVLAEK